MDRFMENLVKMNTADVYRHVVPIWLKDGNYPRRYRFVEYKEIVSRHRHHAPWKLYDILKQGTWGYS